MKEKLSDEIRDIFREGKNWVNLEIEYAKLTLAEKFTVLMSTLVIGAVCLLMFTIILVLLGFSLAELFMEVMNPALAFLSAAGVVLLLAVILFLCRKPLLLNPMAKFITRLFIDK